MSFIQAADHERCGLMFCRIFEPPSQSQGGVDCDSDIIRISGHGWVDIHVTCLVEAWERSDKSGIQSIHRNDLHPGHRPHKMWAKVWQDI